MRTVRIGIHRASSSCNCEIDFVVISQSRDFFCCFLGTSDGDVVDFEKVIADLKALVMVSKTFKDFVNYVLLKF